jgi:hypothetical protein
MEEKLERIAVSTGFATLAPSQRFWQLEQYKGNTLHMGTEHKVVTLSYFLRKWFTIGYSMLRQKNDFRRVEILRG